MCYTVNYYQLQLVYEYGIFFRDSIPFTGFKINVVWNVSFGSTLVFEKRLRFGTPALF